MATQKPRMALTLPEDLKHAIDDLADAWDKPASKVVTELLQEMLPQLQALAQMARHAKSGKVEAAKRVLAHMIGDAAAELVTAGQSDLFPAKKKKSLPPAKVQAYADTNGLPPSKVRK